MRLRIRNVELIINYYFIAVLTLMLVVFQNERIVLCFVFCILHELGHLAAMLVLGERVRSISLDYFGMRIDCGGRIISRLNESVIAAAGPAVNLILAFICRILRLDGAFEINLSLAVFNLLPVKMLDGGRIISSFVNERIVKRIGIAVGIALSAFGAVTAIYTRSNFLILIVSLYVLIGAIKSD